MTATDAILSTRKVRKAYGDFVALNNVDFDLPKGERHALIGPNGAGKSTLVACIAGQLPGVEGSILFKGQEVARLMPADLAKRGIGRTFQISRAFLHLTALENLTSAHVIASGRWGSLSRSLLAECSDKAGVMLATVGLTDRAATRVGDLSLGDRKRLEFGMALACDPDLLLLDEPTAGMSIKERHYLMELVAQRVDETGKTLLFVEHDIDVVLKIAQRVTVMVRGSVLATGAPSEIAANEQVQAVYLGGHH